MTVAVCDSGPLTHLWQIHQWQAFSTFSSVHIAELVAQEVRNHVSLAQMEWLAGHRVIVHTVSPDELISYRSGLSADLSAQDADVATIAVARRIAPDIVLTDDLTLRKELEAQGLSAMGSVGVVLRAFRVGLLDPTGLDQAIDGLFVHSTLYLSPMFKSYVRRLIAEITTNATN